MKAHRLDWIHCKIISVPIPRSSKYKIELDMPPMFQGRSSMQENAIHETHLKLFLFHFYFTEMQIQPVEIFYVTKNDAAM